MSAFEVQVNVEQGLKKLVEFEPITILTASTIVTGEARKLPALIGLGVALKTTGKKDVARVIDVQLHADPKKEGAVLGRVKLLAGGDVTSYVGLLIMLQPLQGVFKEVEKLQEAVGEGGSVEFSRPGERPLRLKGKRKKRGAE